MALSPNTAAAPKLQSSSFTPASAERSVGDSSFVTGRFDAVDEAFLLAERASALSDGIGPGDASFILKALVDAVDALLKAAERSPNPSTQNVCRKRAGDLVMRCETLQQRVGNGQEVDIDQAYFQMEEELRLRDQKTQCKAASACWKVAYSDPDCRNALGLVVIAALVDSLKVPYVPLQERASGALATLSSRCEVNKERIVRAGGHVELAKILFSSSNHSLQINIIQCLNNLVVASPFAELVATPEVLEKIESISREDHNNNPELQENSTIALNNMRVALSRSRQPADAS